MSPEVSPKLRDVLEPDTAELRLAEELSYQRDDFFRRLKGARIVSKRPLPEISDYLGWSIESLEDFEAGYDDPTLGQIIAYLTAIDALSTFPVHSRWSYNFLLEDVGNVRELVERRWGGVSSRESFTRSSANSPQNVRS